jgi:hypothetical protein
MSAKLDDAKTIAAAANGMMAMPEFDDLERTLRLAGSGIRRCGSRVAENRRWPKLMTRKLSFKPKYAPPSHGDRLRAAGRLFRYPTPGVEPPTVTHRRVAAETAYVIEMRTYPGLARRLPC